MLSVLLYAQELLVFQKKDSQQLSMMSSISSHVTNGIILYAKGGAIYHINKRVASFLGIPETTQNMRDIFPDWKEGKKPSFQETILDRPDDVLYLFSYFLQSFRHRQVSLPKILKKAPIQHDWWGNIRELHSVTLRYYIFGDTLNGAYDSLFDIPDENRKESLLDTASLQLDMKHLEKTIQQILIGELQEKGYSQKDIAKLLNVSRQTIFNKLHR